MAFVCGTEQRYRQHIARGEDTDEACRKAHAEYGRQYARSAQRRANMARAQRVRRRAMLALTEEFPQDFARLLRESEKRETEDEIRAMMEEVHNEGGSE